ncbi:MAG: metalloregulator ArsR/SmtB family transcription factor [Ilumatobacteraceae bacterium]
MDGDLQRLLDALSSPIRREILWLVRDQELAAGDIVAMFELSAPTISQHLAVLRESGLLEMRVDGNFRRYRARRDKLVGLEALIAADDRWLPATDIAEAELATPQLEMVVRVSVELPTSAATAFEQFTDPAAYSRWMGVPVTLSEGRFACTLEWGTRIRGVYEVVVPPSLIAMRWDFEDDNVPVPGDERVAYLRVEPHAAGCRVEAQQLVADEREAEFMTVAWSMVLGRLRQSYAAAPSPRPASRRKRPDR